MKHIKKIISAAVGIASVAAFLHWQNTGLVVSRYDIVNNKLPEKYNGMKIVHISDLQDAEIGKNNSRLISKIEEQKPDMIVISGDIVDGHRTDFDNSADFAESAAKIAPVYYVSGNHEGYTGKYDILKEMLELSGVNVLDDEAMYFNENIRIIGAMDPYFNDKQYTADFIAKSVADDKESFNIVLCHRPEMFEKYVEADSDLTFCGHAHGGQIRLPFVGGLFAPHQGILPKYTSGVFTKGGKSMVVSRGIGNSTFPFRIFNRPEVVVVTLKNK